MPIMDDGIYYDLPDEEYHAIQRLSASGVKNLLISPMTFWTRSWLNPNRDNTSTIFQDKGKAYHARICEGPEVFNARYNYSLNPADFPEALASTDDLKNWIRTHNEASEVKLTLGGVKQQIIERILKFDPGVQIWDAIVAHHTDTQEVGVKLLPHDWQFDLERGAAFIERHPTIKHCFIGGHPEVTCLWTNKVERLDTGEIVEVKMKSRFDRLKDKAIIEFKTYGNSVDKPIMKAVYGAIAQGRYHVQAATYYRAVDAAVAAGWLQKCEGEGPQDARQLVFVFQGTGDDPTPIARIMDRRMSWVDLGWRQLDQACLTFDRMSKLFGADPWVEDSTLEHLADEDLPQWAAD